jgi:hypothetical protein
MYDDDFNDTRPFDETCMKRYVMAVTAMKPMTAVYGTGTEKDPVCDGRVGPDFAKRTIENTTALFRKRKKALLAVVAGFDPFQTLKNAAEQQHERLIKLIEENVRAEGSKVLPPVEESTMTVMRMRADAAQAVNSVQRDNWFNCITEFEGTPLIKSFPHEIISLIASFLSPSIIPGPFVTHLFMREKGAEDLHSNDYARVRRRFLRRDTDVREILDTMVAPEPAAGAEADVDADLEPVGSISQARRASIISMEIILRRRSYQKRHPLW